MMEQPIDLSPLSWDEEALIRSYLMGIDKLEEVFRDIAAQEMEEDDEAEATT